MPKLISFTSRASHGPCVMTAGSLYEKLQLRATFFPNSVTFRLSGGLSSVKDILLDCDDATSNYKLLLINKNEIYIKINEQIIQ